MREIVFVNIVQKLSATFGNPKYIDRYYGYIWSINQKYISFNIIETGYQIEEMYIWSINQKYISFNIIETGYQIEEMYVYIFKKLPLARRITYTDYTLLDTMITHTLEKHCFTCDNFLHYKLIGNEYLYFGHGINYECIVKLKRNCLTFSLSEKQLLSETTYRLIPIFYKKFKVNIRDLETIQQILSKCLSLLKNNET